MEPELYTERKKRLSKSVDHRHLYTTQEVSDMFGVSKQTITYNIRNDRLPAVREKGQWLIRGDHAIATFL